MTKSLLVSTSVLAAVATMGGAAVAQDDEIIVTATKREETLQEVPVAVSVVDSDVIEKAQINDILDLQSVVPSLRVSQLERSTNSTFIIRGFGNGGNNIGVEPSVAVFVDGVFRSRVPASIGDLPALERVEVLRGPQNTLFGKGASAGVISIVTQEPQFDWQGSVEGTVGNYNLFQGKGYITGPLSDNVAFSLAGNFQQRDGVVDRVAGEGPDLNDRDRWGIRAQLLYDASDNVTVKYIADWDRAEEVCCLVDFERVGPATQALLAVGGVAPSAPFEYESTVNRTPENEVDNWGISQQLDIAFDWADFQSITSYRESFSFSNGDVDFTNVNAIASNRNEVNIDTFTQEFRLLSNGDGPLSWLVGGFYMNESINNQADLLYDVAFDDYASILSGGLTEGIEQVLIGVGAIDPASGGFFAANTGVQDFFEQENENYSIFAQGDYELNDRWTVTLGVSYINDEKEVEARQVNTDLFSSTDFATVLNNPTILGLLPLDQIPSIGASFDNIVLATAYEAVTMMPFDPVAYGGILQGAALGDPTSQAILDGITAATPLVTPGVSASLADGLAAALAPLQFLPGFVPLPNDIEDNSTEDEEVTYTARVAYDISPRMNVYGSYATGFKPSSWNLTRDSSPFQADFNALQAAGQVPVGRNFGTRFAEAEEVQVFELGFKTTFDRGALNVAVFDQTIDNFQSTIFNGTGFVLANAGEQSVRGFEFDGNYEPVDGLILTAAGTFLDPEYDEFEGAAATTLAGEQIVVDLSGEQPAGIHTVSLFFSALYETDLTDEIDMFVRGDYQYEDEIQVVDNVPEELLTREVNMVNASIGLNWANGTEAFLWGRNIFNDEFFQSGFPTTAQEGSVTAYPNQPATYGVTVRKRF